MSAPRCVAVALSDGLGNQMFQYAAARAVALRAGLPLKLDTGILDGGDGFRRYMLGGFALEAQFLTDAERTALLGPRSTPRTRWWPCRLVDSLRPPHKRRGITQRGWGFDPALLAVRGPCHIRGYWQSEKYFADHAPQIRADFAFREPAPPELARLIGQAGRDSLAALHVRRTDYLAPHTAGIHGVCPEEYYERAVAEVERRAAPGGWLIFSDDPDWVEGREFFRRLGRLVRGDTSRPLDDFRLMSACRHLVIANSTFSWWAAWLGEKEGSVIVGPRKWFADASRDSSGILPERWVSL